jgi:hypothetical protein
MAALQTIVGSPEVASTLTTQAPDLPGPGLPRKTSVEEEDMRIVVGRRRRRSVAPLGLVEEASKLPYERAWRGCVRWRRSGRQVCSGHVGSSHRDKLLLWRQARLCH